VLNCEYTGLVAPAIKKRHAQVRTHAYTKEHEKKDLLTFIDNTLSTLENFVRLFTSFQDYSAVALPSRDALAIEVFKQGNRIFPGDSGEIFECGNIDQASRFVTVAILLHTVFQNVERFMVEE
jgi:hypothetical protein